MLHQNVAAHQIPAHDGFWRHILRSFPYRIDEPTAIRLTLFGLAITLQNGLEFPRGAIRSVLGTPFTAILATAALAGSLALVLAALWRPLVSWRWPRSRMVQIAALVLVLAAVPVGIRQTVVAVTSGFSAPQYPNDGTTLDHFAAIQLLEGKNPYQSSNIVQAVTLLHQDPADTTPLAGGAFSSQFPLHYPSRAQLRTVFSAAKSASATPPAAFESHLSYPSLSFLPLVPLIWAGMQNVVPFFVLAYAVLLWMLIAGVSAPVRPWIILLALADTPVLNGVVAGDLDVWYILLLVVAWRWQNKGTLSAVFLGLSCSAKQLAWFFLPYYVFDVVRLFGWRETIRRSAIAGGVFVLFNLPFVISDFGAWAHGILAPQIDQMFPLGNGLVQLSLAGLAPLAPELVYSLAEISAIGICILWYRKRGAAMPEIALVLSVLPLFFAWRSLSTYFYFIMLPAIALFFMRTRPNYLGQKTASVTPACVPMESA